MSTARDAAYYAAGLAAHDRRVLARAISAAENARQDAVEVYKAVYASRGRPRVIGVTGPPGAGKSTLVNALISELRPGGARVGVIAVDPSSPLTGGAILGDRIRMDRHADDDGVFVRSLASRGHLGGLSRTAARVVDIMAAADLDPIIVETVGAGQSEVEIMEVAQTIIVVCAPGLGDDVQAAKAGILEIADIAVVNKSDSPEAVRTERQLIDAFALRQQGTWKTPVLCTVATTGAGVAELAGTLGAHQAQLAGREREQPARARIGRLLAAAAAEHARRHVAGLSGDRFDALCDQVLRGELDFDRAARLILSLD